MDHDAAAAWPQHFLAGGQARFDPTQEAVVAISSGLRPSDVLFCLFKYYTLSLSLSFPDIFHVLCMLLSTVSLV